MTTPAFHFDAATHTYTLDGRPLLSITQVIEAAGLIDLSRIPASDLEFYEQRGRALHLACQLYDEGDLDKATVDPIIRPRLDAWKRFRDMMPFDIISCERPMYSERLLYAGTPDRIVKLANGECAVIEIKTGPLQPACAIQTAAQVRLWSLRDMAAARYGVHLGANGRATTRYYPAYEVEDDFSIFLGALRVEMWKREHLR